MIPNLFSMFDSDYLVSFCIIVEDGVVFNTEIDVSESEILVNAMSRAVDEMYEYYIKKGLINENTKRFDEYSDYIIISFDYDGITFKMKQQTIHELFQIPKKSVSYRKHNHLVPYNN